MTRITHVEPGLYVNMSNEDYHRAPGISKSGLDMVAVNPSSYQWYLKAPRDSEKLKALDMGSAIHCMLLEPEEYPKRFEIGPDVNRRTNAGKAEEKEFLDRCEKEGITAMTHEEGRQLDLMRDSVMAHPFARLLLEQESDRECSIFWEDEETGEMCKIRPDLKLTNAPYIVDVKKTDKFERIETSIEEFRYHVQDAMYSYGYHQHYGEWPRFYFLIVSSSVSAGRYPVDVIELEPEWKEAGFDAFRENLNAYHHCKSNNAWVYARTVKRPYWAKRGK